MSTLISKREVIKRVGLSYPTLWKMMRQGEFPRSVRLTNGPSAKVAWREEEVENWINSRPRQVLKGEK